MGARRTLGIGLIVLALTSSAHAGLVEDVNIGPAVTIEAPDEYRAGEQFTVSGFLYAQVGLPIVFETVVGVPDERIDVLVDDLVAASTQTGQDGAYLVTLTFGSEHPTTRTIRAVAFRGGALETSSRAVVTSIDHFPIGLRVVPASASIGVGDPLALIAQTTDNDGRTFDVTGEATWSSSDPSVATVSNDAATKGTVRGVSAGSATITATYQGAEAVSAISVG